MTRVLIFGKGLVGSAIANQLRLRSEYHVKEVGRLDLDLRNYLEVENLLIQSQPEVVVNAAGIVGGIERNLSESFALGSENARMLLNILDASVKLRIDKLINVMPACVYPSNIRRRMKPEDLFSGPMEPSSLTYSTAKLLGIELTRAARQMYNLNWISVIATNVYGDSPELDVKKAHVVQALLLKIIQAKLSEEFKIAVLGDGQSVREFLHADDLASAVEFILDHRVFHVPVMNVAGDGPIEIQKLVELMFEVADFEGSISFQDDGKIGTRVKLLDGTFLTALGWTPKIPLKRGLLAAYLGMSNHGQAVD